MAISDLRCTRDGNTLAVTWTWTADQASARITVTRLLDGKEIVAQNIGQALFRDALNSPWKGPVVTVPREPVQVKVEDADNEQTVELLDCLYAVEWRILRENVYQPRRPVIPFFPFLFFFPRKLLYSETSLQMNFPYENPVPGDMFYYTFGSQHTGGPVGYLPTLRSGRHNFGVMSDRRDIVLRCAPRRKEVSRLFEIRRLPDVEQDVE